MTKWKTCTKETKLEAVVEPGIISEYSKNGCKQQKQTWHLSNRIKQRR